jgi:solute carrier family 39 (zinc transporter), member 1/2/3
MPAKLNLIFVLLKQFGTGIIISTAFIHVSHPLRTLDQMCSMFLTVTSSTRMLLSCSPTNVSAI